MMRRLVDAGTLGLGWLRRSRRLPLNAVAAPVCVNLGCGLAVAPGWINVDGSLNALVASMPTLFHRLAYKFTGAASYYSREAYLGLLGGHTFVHHDLKYGLPFDDASVDFVYSSHFLEHLFRQDARRLLTESLRVLKPGGVVRVVVPDLAYAVSLYERGRSEEMLTQYFFVSDDDSYYARHKFMYDFDSLSALLREVGFKVPRKCGYQTGSTPTLDVLDNRPEDSLYVEAVR